MNAQLTPEELSRCDTMIWYGCAHRLLQLGNGVGRPQVRFIMCAHSLSEVLLCSHCFELMVVSSPSCRIAILIGQWLQTSSASGRVTAFLTILAGVRCGQRR